LVLNYNKQVNKQFSLHTRATATSLGFNPLVFVTGSLQVPTILWILAFPIVAFRAPESKMTIR
jgi:hypothetical protein